MDEPNTRWYRWIGANSPHFSWGLWSAGVGGFIVAALSAADPLRRLAEASAAITAIFSVVLAISTIGLWLSTRRLWEAGEKQIEVAARAAGASAESAKAAVDHSRQTAESQLRAYLSIVEHKAEPYQLSIGQCIQPRVTLKNRGQTPANNVRFSTRACYCSPEEAKTIELEPEPDKNAEPFTMAPGEETKIRAAARA